MSKESLFFCRAFSGEVESKGPCGKIAEVHWVEGMQLWSADTCALENQFKVLHLQHMCYI